MVQCLEFELTRGHILQLEWMLSETVCSSELTGDCMIQCLEGELTGDHILQLEWML